MIHCYCLGKSLGHVVIKIKSRNLLSGIWISGNGRNEFDWLSRKQPTKHNIEFHDICSMFYYSSENSSIFLFRIFSKDQQGNYAHSRHFWGLNDREGTGSGFVWEKKNLLKVRLVMIDDDGSSKQKRRTPPRMYQHQHYSIIVNVKGHSVSYGGGS